MLASSPRVWLTVTVAVGSFGDGRELLEVELDDGVGEETRVLFGVAVGDVDNVGFEDDGVDLAVGGGVVVVEGVDGGDGAVVTEAVFATDDAEAGDAADVVEEVEALGTRGCGEAGDDIDVASDADGHVEGLFDGAALDEVLVGLGLVEASDEGPDGVWRRVDALGEEGGALAGADEVGVVLGDGGDEGGELERGEAGGRVEVVVRRVAVVVVVGVWL